MKTDPYMGMRLHVLYSLNDTHIASNTEIQSQCIENNVLLCHPRQDRSNNVILSQGLFLFVPE